jgi:NAD+ synthase
VLFLHLQIYISVSKNFHKKMAKKSNIKVGETNTYIVTWLKEYATKAKVNGFVIGISGGVDSAVTSTLCAQTGLTTLCVEMPIHQDPSQVSRGREHIEQLKKRFPNVQNAESDLTGIFETFKQAVPSAEDEAKLNLSLANTRARLRMTTLYYFAGIHGLLVAGTGNKVEDFGVGFYTKYGDGGVDLSPIADLMKSDVYALGEYLEIPKSIQNAAPTDGLFGDSRTDEDQLGASYDELEWAMTEAENNKKSEDFSGREKEVFEIYKKLNTINQHKMTSIPVCIIPFFLK